MILSFEQIAVSNAVQTAAADLTIPANCLWAELQAATGSIRYTCDGTTPTTTIGMLLVAAADPKLFLIEDLSRFRFIRDGGADATLGIHYGAHRDV